MFEILGKLWPTNLKTEKDVQNWRIIVALSLMFVIATTTLSLALGFGHIPGFPGFADAQVVANIESRLLNNDLINMRERQCRAIEEDNDAAKRFATEKLQELLNEYVGATEVQWRIPECEELI